eukprot:TRINITY_DN9691_c0_g1_i1.p1 TRINITY_DN9691_c0_g1~~TRINITY_DN9691_c0_g1_i1.p1  ORF type:complete len:435 (+),score=81.82 TRINITY_DN9691_c0_g1_i1:13-1317(+)
MSFLDAIKKRRIATKEEVTSIPSEPSTTANIMMWGHGGYWRLAQGDEKHRPTPVAVKSHQLSFIDVDNGAAHIIARTHDGKVYSWGKCHVGQLGHGSEDEDEKFPRLISSLQDQNIVEISCGTSHCFFINEHKNVFSCGFGYFGCLGHGTEKHYSVPTLVEVLKDVKIVKATGGFSHSVFLSDCGEVYTCGNNEYGQLGRGNITTSAAKLVSKVEGLSHAKIVDIYAGSNNTYAISDDGTVYTWGKNTTSELGVGSKLGDGVNDGKFECTPCVIQTLLDYQKENSTNIIKITCGSGFVYALFSNDKVMGWGQRIYLGEKIVNEGDNTIDLIYDKPTLLSFNEHYNIVDISAGDYHTIALTKEGKILTWGEAIYGKLGRESPDGHIAVPQTPAHPVLDYFDYVPCEVHSLSQYQTMKVVAGSNHSLILLNTQSST